MPNIKYECPQCKGCCVVTRLVHDICMIEDNVESSCEMCKGTGTLNLQSYREAFEPSEFRTGTHTSVHTQDIEY
jgi:DnaJ-class molecular chaperone